jgi:hypothetical protein
MIASLDVTLTQGDTLIIIAIALIIYVVLGLVRR